MEIQSGKLALEEHLGQIGQKLSDCTVDTLVSAGVLYKAFEKRIKKAKNKYYKNITVTSFMCDICNKFETDSEEALLKHKRIDHSVVCPIKAEKTLDGLCPHCGEVIMILIFYKISNEIDRNIIVQINVSFNNELHRGRFQKFANMLHSMLRQDLNKK